MQLPKLYAVIVTAGTIYKMTLKDTKFLFAGFLLVFGLLFTSQQPLTDLNEIPKISKQLAAKVDPKQIACLAKNIYYEAGNESVKGQAAVARVVVNRIHHGFGKTPCAVVYQATTVNQTKVCQFSWVCEGKGEPSKNNYRYRIAQQVAYDVMVHDKYKDVVPKSALFFHNLSVNPLWPYAEVLRLGNHVFYSKAKKATIKNKKNDDTI